LFRLVPVKHRNIPLAENVGLGREDAVQGVLGGMHWLKILASVLDNKTLHHFLYLVEYLYRERNGNFQGKRGTM
jgi:hypothetical protein